jgi:uncharacterized membrane protein required for colicin V production
MNLLRLQVNWVDVVVVSLLIVGVVRGRKRGMSQELLDMLQWFFVVVLAGLAYEPGGRWLSQAALLGLLSGYLGAYALVFLTVFLTFSFIRARAADKLANSDAFGGAEFYLGMVGGGFRYLCVLLVCLAFLNARYFTPQEIQAQQRFQTENYGSSFFPTLAGIQQQVFEGSLSGRCARDYLPVLLIRPTAPGDRASTPSRAPSSARRRPRS